MVPLAADVRTNTGEMLGRCGGPALNRLGLIGRSDRVRFPMLCGIDPYADTTFNGLQMEMLRDELVVIGSESADAEVVDMTAQLLALVDTVVAGVHRTLVFVGD